MYRVVMIGEAAVPMESAASIDLSFKHIFGADPMKLLTNAKDEADAIDFFTKMAFVMAKFAELHSGRELRKLNEDAFLDWLDKFDRTDLMQVLGEVQDVYVSAKQSESEAKKNSD